MLFTFCPRCKYPITPQDQRLFYCDHCDFHYYTNPVPCNAVIIENNKGEILLVKRKRTPKKGYWDLPGGFIDYHETVEESVHREIREELGIELQTFSYFTSTFDLYRYKGVTYHTLGLIFTARLADQQPRPSDDVTETTFFHKENIPFSRIAFPSLKKALKDYINSA